MSKYSIGIDTSNYKCSVAVVDNNEKILFEKSYFLDVKEGERGLRQSEAFFQHSNKLPQIFNELFKTINSNEVINIGVSNKPRRINNSYMPCFQAGVNAAKMLSCSLHIPFYEFSHQEGHAAAILDKNNESKVLFYHLSGGTTEFLLCQKNINHYDMEIIGGTKDISFGQLLDRIGVAVGCDFPSGKYLDEIAYENKVVDMINNIKLSDNKFNLSGIETKVLRIIQNSKEKDILSSDQFKNIISSVFYQIAQIIYKTAHSLSDEYGVDKVYIAGGVAASKTIKRHILDFKTSNSSNYIDNKNIDFIFTEPKLSGDNAIGIARLAARFK